MKKSSKASLGFIFATILIDVIGIGIIIPVIPSLIESLNGPGTSEAAQIGGWLIFSYAIMQFVFAPFLGVLSDKFGRKPILLIALFGLGVDYFVHAFAPSLFWLFLGRILAGLCGASFTVATAYIADISTPETKAQNFGLIGAAFGLGFIIGPVLGGLAGEYDVKYPFFIAGGLTLLNFLYGVLVLPESLEQSKRKSKIDLLKANPIGSFHFLTGNKIVWRLAIAFFFLYLAGYAVQSTWPFYGKLKFEWTESMIGLSLGIVGIVVAVVQGLMVKHTLKWWGEKKTIFIGYVSWFVGLLLFAFVNQSWLLFASVLPYCFGGIATPTLQSIVSNKFGDSEQGELQGALTSLISLTAVIGPVVMTSIFAYFTTPGFEYFFPGAPFLLAAVFILVSFVISYTTMQKKSLEDAKAIEEFGN